MLSLAVTAVNSALPFGHKVFLTYAPGVRIYLGRVSTSWAVRLRHG
jgi:hypothetical protein